jgi:F-type H+-transporting ATPase subunit epsilon
MAFDKIDLEIVTPERLVLAATVEELILPGSEGYLGVLPGHAPLLTALGAGEISYRIGAAWQYLAVSGGFAEILRDRVSVLAETCERPDEIDVDRALASKKRAEGDLAKATGESELLRAQERIAKADARLMVRRRRGAAADSAHG